MKTYHIPASHRIRIYIHVPKKTTEKKEKKRLCEYLKLPLIIPSELYIKYPSLLFRISRKWYKPNSPFTLPLWIFFKNYTNSNNPPYCQSYQSRIIKQVAHPLLSKGGARFQLKLPELNSSKRRVSVSYVAICHTYTLYSRCFSHSVAWSTPSPSLSPLPPLLTGMESCDSYLGVSGEELGG